MSFPLPVRKTPASRWRQRALASACALALALPTGWTPVNAQNALPALGDTDSADFTVSNERKLGDDIMRQVRTDPDYVDDPLLLEYLQSVWQPLVAASKALGNITPDLAERFAWEPFLVRDPSVNAFAWPGGYVGVHLGMIAITTTSDELASVLAHEMSHVSQRHIARSITGDSKRSLVGLAALLLGVLAASRSHSPDAANAVIAGSQAATAQGQLNFSRDVEREADRVGFQVLVAAGYAPGSMAAMFERMDRATHLNDYGGYPYLRSHPLNADRIGEARTRASAREAQITACTVGSDGVCRMPTSTVVGGNGSTGEKIVGSGAPALASVLEHTVAQARASVLMDPRTDALRRWQARDADRGGTAADKLRAACESAFASSMLHDWTRADAAFATARTVVHGAPGGARAERAVVLMQAQSLVDRGAAAQAAEEMKAYANDGSRPSLLLDSEIALRMAPATAPDSAPLKANASTLQTWVAVHPNDPLAWTALAQTWSKLGQPLRSIRAEAEARYALGDLQGAVDRLRAGQKLARGGGPVDFIDASVLDSRLRTIEAQRRQLVADQHAGH